VNVIVADKQSHLVYLDMDAAVIHCHRGNRHLGLGQHRWRRGTGRVDGECGRHPDEEALAAVAILRERLPDLKIRFVNVVDLYRLQPSTEHPHGLSDRDFDSLFTKDKPVIFNFHGYPGHPQVHLSPHEHDNIHVRGYKEKGNIIRRSSSRFATRVDRFNLAIDVIDRVPRMQARGRSSQGVAQGTDHRKHYYAYAEGIDKPEIRNWKWPSAV